ncbi:hypothetical protein ACWD5V_39475 [Streptomyces sp. NPDC002523]
MIGGTRALFPDDTYCADLAQALEAVLQLMAAKFTTFCVKPSQFADDPDGIDAFCREVICRVESLTP